MLLPTRSSTLPGLGPASISARSEFVGVGGGADKEATSACSRRVARCVKLSAKDEYAGVSGAESAADMVGIAKNGAVVTGSTHSATSGCESQRSV